MNTLCIKKVVKCFRFSLQIILMISMGSCKQAEIQNLIVANSLRLNVSEYKKEALKFLKSKEAKSLKKLELVNSLGWDATSYYKLEGKEYIRLVDGAKPKGWVDVLPYTVEIAELKNLEELDFSFSRASKFPEGIGELTQLKVLDISFNPALNWEEIIPHLAKLKSLKILRAFGILTAQQVEVIRQLKTLLPNVEIRYTLAQFHEDTKSKFKEIH